MGIGTPERKLQRREQITSILRAAPLRRMRLSDLGNRSKRNKGELRLRKLLISTPHIFRVFIRGEVELIVAKHHASVQVHPNVVEVGVQSSFSLETRSAATQVVPTPTAHVMVQVNPNVVEVGVQSSVSLMRAPASPHPGPRVLVLGDGDLGFSRSVLPFLADGTSLVTTVFEYADELLRKYPSAKANLAALTSSPSTTVLFGIDVRTLAESSVVREIAFFDVMVFNFPRTSLTSEVCNSDRDLLLNVLMAAGRILVPHGMLFITLRDQDVVTNPDRLQFQEALHRSGLRCVYSFPFCHCKLAEYSPKMTNNNKVIPHSGNARTYVVVNPSAPQFSTSIVSSVLSRLTDSLGAALRGVVG